MGLDNETTPFYGRETLRSKTHGPPTIVYALERDKLIPVLTRRVASEVVAAGDGSRPWITRFGLPFGLVAHATVEPYAQDPENPVQPDPLADPLPPKTKVALNAPVFAGTERFVAATQVRVLATGSGAPGGATDPSRDMTGNLQQTENLLDNSRFQTSVLPRVMADAVNNEFAYKLPLHHGDLSGYGLSTFSHWRKAIQPNELETTGVAEARFDVAVGRTSYEVIQLNSRLWHPQARVIRTVIIERGNSANVYVYDSGWVAIEDGECQRYAGIATGVVKRYRNIRNIRILPKPEVVSPGGVWKWQEVLYDADLQLVPNPIREPDGYFVPIRDHVGYVQNAPINDLPGNAEFVALMNAIGGRPIGGPIDAHVRLAGTLAMQLSQVEVAHAPGGAPMLQQFFLAVRGAPALPRAGQWNAVAIDGTTKDVASVDARRGVPVIRRITDREFIFRDPGAAYAANATDYGLMLSTPAARVLFPGAQVDVYQQRELTTAAPYVADPSALAMASGMFPRLPFTLNCAERGRFTIDDIDNWKLTNDLFTFTANPNSVAAGAGWNIQREFTTGLRQVGIPIDSANLANPWKLSVNRPDDLKLKIDPFGEILTIRSAFKAAGNAVPGFEKPTVLFGDTLSQLKKIVSALEHFVDLGFNVDVDVSAGNGPTPSFLVRLAMRLRLPETPNTRVDIGVGKFRGSFELTGQLQAAPNGITTGRLGVELSGDLQQGIIPPVLFAGGQFRFVARVTENGKPEIEFGFGTAASVGGALIKGLLELEATVRYGYTLVPETLKPGVMLGIEARAKLLGGLIGFSFGAEAFARIERLNSENVTIWAELRVAATIQIAVLIEEEVDFRTQFQQTIPLAAIAAGTGAGPLALALASQSL